MDDLSGWCRDHLGEPVEVLFRLRQTSSVVGFRLADGREVVVKARDDDGRAASCVAAQAALAARGLPVARPLTEAVCVGPLAVHAEEYRPGGEVKQHASAAAAVFARLMAALCDVTVAPPLPNPRWVRWDRPDSAVWSAFDDLAPSFVVDTARRVRERLLATDLPCVLGHADFEAQNLRWKGPDIWAVHDWDSLAWQPEAALVGAASGAFASAGPPTLAPMADSAEFLSVYQAVRGRRFSAEETEVAWAAGVWVAAHNARWETVHGAEPISGDALRAQAADRLRLGGL